MSLLTSLSLTSLSLTSLSLTSLLCWTTLYLSTGYGITCRMIGLITHVLYRQSCIRCIRVCVCVCVCVCVYSQII